MRHLRNPFVQVGLWTFAITAVVGVVVWTVPWEPEQASTAGRPDRHALRRAGARLGVRASRS